MVINKKFVAVLSIFCTAFSSDGLATEVLPARDTVTLRIHCNAPVARSTEAFGPVSESRWAPEFKPSFLYPRHAEQRAGAVFTTPEGRYWILHAYEPANGRVEYIIIYRQSYQITLTISVRPTRGGSEAVMRYDVIAFDGLGLQHVHGLRAHASNMAVEMQSAIAGYLKRVP